MTIDETFVEDSANWSVRASNQAGYAESHAKLTVQELKPVKEPFKPIFIEPLVGAGAKEGGSYEFKCRVSGYPNPQVSWFKNGVCVDKSLHYTLGEYEGECILKMDTIHLEDAGEFSCKASNKMGGTTTAATLSVTPLEPTELPTFDDPLINLEVKTGQPVNFECAVHGIPKPAITWYHNNRLLRSGPDVEISYIDDNAKLSIKEAYPKVSGQYICKAKNIAGELDGIFRFYSITSMKIFKTFLQHINI